MAIVSDFEIKACSKKFHENTTGFRQKDHGTFKALDSSHKKSGLKASVWQSWPGSGFQESDRQDFRKNLAPGLD